MRILMVSSEAAPFAKTGGLADVLGALPEALARAGHDAAVVLPRYRSIPLDGMTRVWDRLQVWFHGAYHLVDIWSSERGGATFYFLDCPALFDREGIYGDRAGDFGDNHVRYAVLSLGALGVARHLFRPDILHSHDWQAGLVPLYVKNFYPGDPTFAGVKNVFTIHNLGYQGLMSRASLNDVGLDDRYWRGDLLEFYGTASLLKAGLVYADRITTVSPTYAREIQTPEHGFRMDGLLRARSHELTGILNGVDYGEWNPATDKLIAANYSPANMAGKRECKAALLREFGFDVEKTIDRPLVGVVSRFAEQKGLDMIAQVYHEFAARNMTFIALGSGDSTLEAMFRSLELHHREKCRAWIGFNNRIAHAITAGADLFLMPSRYEPCGLNQMYSLKYGTVPVVRATGGLEDTVEDGITGFKFSGVAGWDMLACLSRGLAAFEQKEYWAAMMAVGMSKDNSWDHAADEYAKLYGEMLAGR